VQLREVDHELDALGHVARGVDGAVHGDGIHDRRAGWNADRTHHRHSLNLFSYWKSDSLVPSMHGAQEVNDRTAPEFVGLVRELATHPSTENRIAALEEIAASMGGGVGSPRLRRSGWRG